MLSAELAVMAVMAVMAADLTRVVRSFLNRLEKQQRKS
jgi:type II secretory pathway component PulK